MRAYSIEKKKIGLMKTVQKLRYLKPGQERYLGLAIGPALLRS